VQYARSCQTGESGNPRCSSLPAKLVRVIF
jgi:hypothetical protein